MQLKIDGALIREAQRLGNHRSKGAAVSQALKEYVTRRKQLEIFSLFGSIDYSDGYSYKAMRKRR